MREGFFKSSTLAQSKPPPSLIPQCGACGLFKSCRSPKMQVTGKGRKGILLVTDYPDRAEDKAGVRFVGDQGRYALSVLKKAGIKPDRDCWATSALLCNTGGSTYKPENVGHCRPNMAKTIKTLKPSLVILMGPAAISSVVGMSFTPDNGPNKWAGWQIPDVGHGCYVCPTYDPFKFNKDHKEYPLLRQKFEQHIDAAVDLVGERPQPGPWHSERVEDVVDVEHSPKRAYKAILKALNKTKTAVAFDYETNALKPETPGARIVSCSICFDGEYTISYPWTKKTAEATWAVLRSDLPKIASNMKFEQRWTTWYFGDGVRNWWWDTMLAAHVLDNRTHITSVKFQAYVLLGVPDYSAHISKYLKSEGDTKINNIHLIDMADLLKYGGLDSLVEYYVAMKQAKRMGVSL